MKPSANNLNEAVNEAERFIGRGRSKSQRKRPPWRQNQKTPTPGVTDAYPHSEPRLLLMPPLELFHLDPEAPGHRRDVEGAIAGPRDVVLHGAPKKSWHRNAEIQ